jgi:peptidoglycan hydrolase CwlO-like protein
LDEQFREVKNEIREVKEDVQSLQTSVDKLAGQVLSFQQEMTIISMKVNRMESWIQTVSVKIGVPYEA